MNPWLLLVPFGGVGLVVLLVFWVWGKDEAKIESTEALEALFQKRFPKHVLLDLIVDSAQRHALGREQTTGDLVVFYAHGDFINIRRIASDELLRVRFEEKEEQGILHLFTKAFDRSHFALSFLAEDGTKERAFAWYEQWCQLEKTA